MSTSVWLRIPSVDARSCKDVSRALHRDSEQQNATLEANSHKEGKKRIFFWGKKTESQEKKDSNVSHKLNSVDMKINSDAE